MANTSDCTRPFVQNPDVVKSLYPSEMKQVLSRASGAVAHGTVSGWSGYAPTPLVALNDLAKRENVAAVQYKHEATRFGLNSFKALGGAYAALRLLARLASEKNGTPVSEAEILSGSHAELAAGITLCCATDGNHGRSVAWGGQMFGCEVVIFLHADVTHAREQAISAYGAKIVRTAGNYDDSVRAADKAAAENGWFVVSDTSYPGYIDVPRDVMQGYAIMVEEAITQLDKPATHVFVQGGVGGLAAAVTATLWEAYGPDRPQIILVEPETAGCLYESAREGQPTAVHGGLETIMAGLACGEPSLIAWPILRGGAYGFMLINDTDAANTMRLLASGKAGATLVAGESGVAGLAGFLALDPGTRTALGINARSRLLFFGSEGDTDPQVYAEITGATGDALRAAGAI